MSIGLEPVGRIVAAGDYEGASRSLVLDLKLGGRRSAAVPLAEMMTEAVLGQGLRGSVLTWVPGRRRDIRRRGFDHAELLARASGGRLGLPVRGLLVRSLAAADQTTLTAVERRRNLQGVFAARRCAGEIVVVDDLVTTGATAEACARALIEAGATSVEVLVACRA